VTWNSLRCVKHQSLYHQHRNTLYKFGCLPAKALRVLLNTLIHRETMVIELVTCIQKLVVKEFIDDAPCKSAVLMYAERKSDKCRLYNFSRIKKTRKWLKVWHCFVSDYDSCSTVQCSTM